MTRSPNAIFHEIQNLRQHWLAALLLPAGIFLIGLFVYAMVQQLILGKPFGDRPMSDPLLIGFGIVYVFLGVLLLALYFTTRLITEVRPDGVYIRFTPFHRHFKRIGKDELGSYEAVTYRPIRDYGGWGIRSGRKGRAYNITGSRGVQLELNDGKRVLIGSQKADMMVEAIRSIG